MYLYFYLKKKKEEILVSSKELFFELGKLNYFQIIKVNSEFLMALKAYPVA